MKAKVVALFVLILCLGFTESCVISQITLKKTRPIVREPATPEESTLSYTQPSQPKFQLDTIKEALKLKAMIKPRIDKITDDIYLARGIALGSVQMVITSEGLVIIDSTESKEAAAEVLAEFRKITDKPIRYLIYAHGHLDHVQGAPVFVKDSPSLEVIATKDCVEFMKKDLEILVEFHMRSRSNQAGLSAPEYARKLPIKSPVRLIREQGGLVWPTIAFDQKYSFTLGGKKFELYHTQGETPDHLMVWLPDERALFSGDLYYESFPNLSTPMLEPRQVKGWYESLDRMIKLNPEYLIPGHTAPITGEENVRETLSNYSAAIRYVYEETLRCINEGKSVEEAVQLVKLPEKLAQLDYLQEYYGRIDWSVRGIYQGIVGWYDGKGTGLNPLPSHIYAREMLSLSGGADKVLARAIELQKAGEHQLVCELCDVVIAANSKDKLAHLIKASSLEYLGYTCGNLNMFGFYRSAAALERQAAEENQKP
jgi:alkyl sulfatase BDS1-like metallo-beta-lactamase superfamily hydrolase